MRYTKEEIDQYYDERHFAERQDMIYGRNKDLVYSVMTIYSIGENLYAMSQLMTKYADKIIGRDRVEELSRLKSKQIVEHAKANYEEALVMLLYKTGQVFQSRIIGTGEGIGGLLQVYKKAKRYIAALESVAKDFEPENVTQETRDMIEAFQNKFDNISQLNTMLFDSFSDTKIPFKNLLIKFPVNLFGSSGVVAQRFKQQLDNHKQGIRGKDVLEGRMPIAIHKLIQRRVTLNSEIFKLNQVLNIVQDLNPKDRKFSAMVMFNNVSPVYLPDDDKVNIYNAVKAFQEEYRDVDWAKVKPTVKGSHKERETDDRNIAQRAVHKVIKRFREGKKVVGEALQPKKADKRDEKFNDLKKLVIESLSTRIDELEHARDLTQQKLSRAQRNPFLIFYNFLVRVFSRTPAGPTVPEAPEKAKEVTTVHPIPSDRFKKGGRGHGRKKALGKKSDYDHPVHVGRRQREEEAERKTFSSGKSRKRK